MPKYQQGKSDWETKKVAIMENETVKIINERKLIIKTKLDLIEVKKKRYSQV